MSNLIHASAVALAVILGLCHSAAFAQEANSPVQFAARIKALAAPEAAMGARFGRLMETQQFRVGADMCCDRVGAWRYLSDEIWEGYLQHPSVSMSLLWEAAVTRLSIWASMYRGAIYHRQGFVDMALVELRIGEVRSKQFQALCKSAGSAYDDEPAQ